MKQGIHPEYVEAHVRCTCGNEFTTRSTKPELHVEICSNCHPFYTGRQKLVDTGGRVKPFTLVLALAAVAPVSTAHAAPLAGVKVATCQSGDQTTDRKATFLGHM